jgi:rod shape determining protein RodA
MTRILWRNFDFWLLGMVALLTVFGITMIRSTIAGNIELIQLNVVQRQLIFGIAGFVIALVIASIDYHFWSSVNRPMYLTIVGLLAMLNVVGVAVFGATRWFQVGAFFIQPSELAKVVMILVLAEFFSASQGKLGDLRWVLRSFLLTSGVVIWVLLQPNLSTSIVIYVIWFSMLWVSGFQIRHLLYVLGVATIFIAILAIILLNVHVYDIATKTGIIQPYQVDRILTFLFPDPEASYGATYNVNQALISIGSGGILGKGYGQGSQVQLRFLKVRHSDFIFAAISEEFGFVGVALVIALQLFIIIRCIRIAQIARDTFGALIAYGVATLLAFQGIVNMGMNLNLMPVTGLTLPFISYGGSSLLSNLLGIGLVESVAVWHKALEF